MLVRIFVLHLVVEAFLAAFIAPSWLPCADGQTINEPTSSRQYRGLKDFAPARFSIGGAIHGNSDALSSPAYLAIAERDFDSVVITALMGYGAWPDPSSSPNTTQWKSTVDWAASRGKRVRGSTLVYPLGNQSLDWWNRLTPDRVEEHLRRFVTDLAGSRAGKVWVWDVVNEVIADDGSPQDADGLRTEFLEYRSMGPAYIEKAFQWAKRADPNALLIINDYGAEEVGSKSDRLYAFVKKLRSQGVPIDGVGFQMHWQELTVEPNYDSIAANFQRFADAGFRVFITEMDIVCKIGRSANDFPSPAELDRQKRIYKRVLDIALRQDHCDALWLWDFADERSWLHPADRQVGVVSPGHYTFPTPFWRGKHPTANIVAKPAYRGLYDALNEYSTSTR